MFTASEKRKENIAEYLLYMWQIEDIIRANNLDIDNVERNIIDHYTNLNDNQKKQLREWYESLIEMMRMENVEKSGHLQINKNIMMSLVELHQALMKDPRFANYSAEFYRTLPYVVELRSKSGEQKSGEIETCFNALYGVLILRLRGKEISADTVNAIKQISQFISLLSSYFHKNEREDIFQHND